MRPSDRAYLALLVVDGIVIGLLSATFAYLRIGGVIAPIAALAAGLANAGLVWLAAGYTDGRGRVAPLVAWLLTILVLTFPGPGGDTIVSTAEPEILRTLILLVVGAGIPFALLMWGRLPDPNSR